MCRVTSEMALHTILVSTKKVPVLYNKISFYLKSLNCVENNMYFFILQLFTQFGLPRVITSDQGSEFNNCVDKKL